MLYATIKPFFIKKVTRLLVFDANSFNFGVYF